LLAQKRGLKDEKRKLEYDIYDLLKLNLKNKENIKRARAICDE
jgi:hypothetical protein